MSSRASESKVRPSSHWRAEQALRPANDVGAEAAVDPSGRTPTLLGLGSESGKSSGRLRLVQGGASGDVGRLRLDESTEESAFFERGQIVDALAPTTWDREVDPPWSPKVSARRRVQLRRLVASVVGLASILAALAAAKAMVPPLRGSLDPTPEPTEPIVVAMGALDSKPISVPSIGRELRAPSKRKHRVRVGEAPRHRARGTRPASTKGSPHQRAH